MAIVPKLQDQTEECVGVGGGGECPLTVITVIALFLMTERLLPCPPDVVHFLWHGQACSFIPRYLPWASALGALYF